MIMQRLLAVSASSGATDPYFSSVILLLHFNDTDGTTANLLDSSSYNHTSSTSCVYDTTVKKFGSSSIKTVSNYEVLSTIPTALSSLGTGDFTVECFIQLSHINTFYKFLGNTSGTGWYFSTYPNDGSLYLSYNNAQVLKTGNNVLTVDQMHHVAWTKESGVSKIWVDGVLEASGADTNSYDQGNTTVNLFGSLGANQEHNYDDYKITKGIARYT